MDRPQFRIIAVCSLALLLASAGCRGVPSRRVPPEQPYGDPTDPTSAGFGAVAPPSMDYGGAYGPGDPSYAPQPTDPYNSGAPEANPYGDYGNAPGIGGGVPGLDPPAGEAGAVNPFPDAGQDPSGLGLPDGGVSPP